MFIVPDTNVWFNKRRELFNVLECFKDFVVVALPHITIDEMPPETYKYAILSKLDEKTDYELFRQKLENSIQDARARGFKVTSAPIPGVWNVSRFDLMVWTSEDIEVAMDLAV